MAGVAPRACNAVAIAVRSSEEGRRELVTERGSAVSWLMERVWKGPEVGLVLAPTEDEDCAV